MMYKSVSSRPLEKPTAHYAPTAAAEAEQDEQLQAQENHTASFQEVTVIYRMYSAFCSSLKKEIKLINLFLEMAECSTLMTAE